MEMSKKSIFSVILAITLLISVPIFIICSGADNVPTAQQFQKKVIYAPNGKSFFVPADKVDEYLALGYGERIDDVKRTLYTSSGNVVSVFISEVDKYRALGYSENLSDVQTPLYSRAGEIVPVFSDYVEEYKKLGYRETIEEVQVKMYSIYGEEKIIFLAESDEYYRNGWRQTIEEVSTYVYSPSGEKVSVFKGEVSGYISRGWKVMQSDRIDPSKPMIALTFDDGPRPGPTARILNQLEAYNARATFFVVGEFAAGQGALLNRMRAINCQIGNHTYSHPNLTTLSASGISSEITRTANIVYNATGTYPTVVRPPYGARNATVSKAANAPLILWSVDTLDWQTRNTQMIVDHVLNTVRDGDIVLMHDLYDTTAAAAEILIPELIARGYQLVTVSELATYRNTTLVSGNAYNSFRK